MKTRIVLILSIISVLALAANIVAIKTIEYKRQNVMKLISDKDFEKEWKKVDSLIGKGLPKSALEIVEVIYTNAKSQNNAAHFVKAVIYKMKLLDNVEEDAYVKNINQLENEVSAAEFPIKPILQSMLAEMYWRYYQQNRYLFLNRTETANFDQKDIRTWDLKKIVKEVIANHLEALKDADKLKDTPVKTYDAVITKGYNSAKYRPTLYDFLAHRAIDFFMNDETGLAEPIYKFELNSMDYFQLPEKFSRMEITTKDSLSLKYYAIKLLQDLTVFHLKDSDPQALIDVDLKRVGFVYSHAIIEAKDSIYLEYLINLEIMFAKYPSSTDISYAIANQYYTRGLQYKPLESEKNKWMLKTAYDKCEQTISKYPETDGSANCKYLQDVIKGKNLTLTTEDINVPNKVFRALVSYKNVPEISIRFIKMESETDKKLVYKHYGQELIEKYLKFKPVKEISVKLTDDGDFQTHAAEIKMPELPTGYYVVLVCNNNNFSINNNVFAYSNFWVSNISYISRQKPDYSYDFYLMNRETGEPLANASAQMYFERYNYVTSSYEYIKGSNFTSNSEGYFQIPSYDSKDYSRNFYMEFKTGTDELNTDRNFYQYKYYPPSKYIHLQTFFFTDRAIYRPGQTIYFKGILLETDDDKTWIKPNQSTTVIFYDVNGQQVSKLELTTNDYGTFSGTFTAPSTGLTGQMYITNSSGYQYFSVEEYKRPKFEVVFEPVKGSYKLGETITIKGKGKAYAGNNIDNAQVKYRVVRTARFPYWYYWWWGYYPTSPQMEITNGTVTSDENGLFTINFTAVPDKSISKSSMPTFDYMIYADVTDINGETRSGSKSVSVGYTALNLYIDVPNQVNKLDKNIFELKTTNLSGESEPAKGTITVYKLKQPDRTFRDRKWTRPDKFLMTKAEYYDAFPYDLYDDENNKYKWEKESKVLEYNFETPKDSSLKVKNLDDWKQGNYVLEMKSKDVFGEEVKFITYFTVFSVKETKICDNSVDWFFPIKSSGEPGENASFAFGTKEKNIRVLYEVEHQGKTISKQWLTLSDELKTFEIPIIEEYRGNFSTQITFIKNGRSYSHQNSIYVPYTNKELDIQYETFRSKLQPGEKEQWKIKIKGKHGEKVAAEMLSAMYDASLDAFRANYWMFSIYKTYYPTLTWDVNSAFNTVNSNYYSFLKSSNNYYVNRYYDALNWFGFDYYYGYYYGGYRGAYEELDGVMPMTVSESKISDKEVMKKSAPAPPKNGVLGGKDKMKNDEAPGDITTTGQTLSGEQSLIPSNQTDLNNVTARSNFAETAFFYPHLETDEEGSIIISFTVPESLTKWKIMGFAHTKDLKYGFINKELVTQKELMVQPNPPRFFREGDIITFSSKISNISEKDLTGEAKLMLFDAMTMQSIDGLLKNNTPVKSIEIKKGQSTAVEWTLTIPEGIEAISYKVVAKAGNFSDGEEKVIPVLTNRMLVTESLPLPIKGMQTKTFTFKKMVENKSTTLRNYKYTLEFSSNPAWYAIQALPYLMEYPYECAEQVFSRFYANSIASHIANSSPKIKKVFDSWKNITPNALLSNLEKNQELKSLMLEETPWVMNAQNESERKQRVALLFDLNRMANELGSALNKLEKMQVYSGGWPWFPGMPESRYITQHVVTGMGHLDHLGVKNIREDKKAWNMTVKAVQFLDNQIRKDYEWIKKWYPKEMDKNHIGSEQIQYLYARSYFMKDVELSSKNKEAFEYFKGQAKTYWLSNNIYLQGMIALALHRFDDKVTPQDIMKSLKEKALYSEEMGMYWKDLSTGGWYWYQAPIETQALLIEAFDEVANDKDAVEEMKVWLLKQKQTQDWKTTKATVEACYALLLRGTDVLASDKLVEISLGGQVIDPKKLEDVKIEAGTGYFKTSWSGSDIKPEMGNIKLTKKDEGVAWGAVYWQYFEQLDKITPHETPLKLEKKLFLQKNSPTGPIIEPITEKTILKVGDKIKVRIELRVDRDMEYVHMKDMRASGFEPINVISQYKYQGGLGYYESTKDAATNFFFSYLPKGTYVFEYPLFVSNKGDFSNGITTIQCMYAPEFTAHSEGIRVKVGE
jgi:uncharacterized protein YfaS (alpha-2-macroglobulin family)